jgi:hypothetical protein
MQRKTLLPLTVWLLIASQARKVYLFTREGAEKDSVHEDCSLWERLRGQADVLQRAQEGWALEAERGIIGQDNRGKREDCEDPATRSR